MAFATIEDLEARWRTLSEAEVPKATALLDDASAILVAQVDVDPTDEQQATLLKVVCCSMVTRSMVASESDVYGISQLDYGMGPFSQAAHFSNPNGDLYLTAQERQLLGIGSGGYVIDLRAQVGDCGA